MVSRGRTEVSSGGLTKAMPVCQGITKMRCTEGGLTRHSTARMPPRYGSGRLTMRERLICLRRKREEGHAVVGIAVGRKGLRVSSISTSSIVSTAAAIRSTKKALVAIKADPLAAISVSNRLTGRRGARQMPTNEI